MFHVKHYLANALNPDSDLPFSDPAQHSPSGLVRNTCMQLPLPTQSLSALAQPDEDSDMNHTTVI